MLARIKWSDLHRVNHPGIYLLPDGRSRVQVGAKHIVLWTADPRTCTSGTTRTGILRSTTSIPLISTRAKPAPAEDAPRIGAVLA